MVQTIMLRAASGGRPEGPASGTSATVIEVPARRQPWPRQVVAPPASPPPGGTDFGIDLAIVWQMVLRRLPMAVAIAVILTGLAAYPIIRLPSTWTADALVVLNLRQSKVAELQSATDTLLSRSQTDISVMRTETEVLTSRHHLESVARRLQLADDRAFLPYTSDPTPIERLQAAIHEWLPLLPPPPRRSPPGLDDALEQLGRSVQVLNDGGSYAMRVRVETLDPILSADIANAVAEVYLEDQQREKVEAGAAASTWLSGKLEELRAAVLESDQALESYRARNQLGKGERQSLLDARVAELNGAIVAAQGRLGRAQANVSTAEAARGDPESAAAVLASPTIQTLREQEAELLVRSGQLEQTMLPRHPRRLEADAELRAIRAKIRLEIERMVGGLRSEAAATRSEVAALQGQLSGLQGQRRTQASAEVALADLERGAEANRFVYTEFLKQFNATTAQGARQTADARLADPARPPAQASGPKRKLLLIGAAMASAAVGLLLSIALGWLRGGLAGPAPLEQATGVSALETMPELSHDELAKVLAGALPTPSGAAFRSLGFTLESRLPEGGTLLITSAAQGEGKSILSMGLARMLGFARKRVLLVDLDPWRPKVTRLAERMGCSATGRMIGPAAVWREPRSGVEILLPLDEAATADPNLFVDQIVEVLPRLREMYDLILLDAPPVLAIPEVLLAAQRADATLLVVRFEHTRASTVRQAVQRLEAVGCRPMGAVLTRVDPRNFRRYGYGDVSYYGATA